MASLLGIVLGAGLVGVILEPVTAASVPAGWPTPGASWTNGVVLCRFDSGTPSVSVSALGLADSGLSTAPGSIEEVSPAGSLVATASLSGANWTATNDSTSDAFDQSYSAHVAIASSPGPAPTVGSVDVRVDYDLAAYAENSRSNLSSVSMRWDISNWTWQESGDRLVLTLTAWPSVLSAERLVASSPSGLTSLAVGSGELREYLELPEVAASSVAGSSPTSVVVSPQLQVGPTNASIRLSVAASAGAFTSLTYSLTLGVPVSETFVGLPLSEYLLVLGAGSTVVVAAAVAARRIRQRPSGFVLVAEDP